jgi:hypothetical protein
MQGNISDLDYLNVVVEWKLVNDTQWDVLGAGIDI